MKRKATVILAAAAVLASVAPAAAQRDGAWSVRERQGGTPIFRESRPPTLSGAYLAARLAGALKDVDAAADYYRRALQADPQNPYLIERAFLLALASGEVEQAAHLARRLIPLDKANRFARLTLAVEAIRKGALGEARSQLQEGGKGPLVDLSATLLTAWMLAGENKADEALAAIDALEGPEWYAIFKNYHASLIVAWAGRTGEAEQRFRRAYEADRGALRIVEAYARFLARQGRAEEAQKLLQDFGAAVPNHPVVTALQSMIANGLKPEPLVETVKDGAAEALYGLGAALGQDGGEDLGSVYLALSLHLRPNQPLALLSLADAFVKAKQDQKAISILERVPRESPLYRNAQIQRDLLLDLAGRTEEAIQQLEILIEANQTDFDAITALGNILRSHKRFAEAAAVYTRAIDQIDRPEKRHWALYYFRGMSYERSNQWPKAETDLKQALALMPDQALILNYLGYSWVDQGKNLDQGLELIKRAVELKSEDGYIVDSLGWAYYRLGRYDDAVRELEKAVDLKPEDPVINDHLGDAYWTVGRRLEAQFQWTHARDLKPEPDDLAKIEEKLKHGLKAPERRNAADAR